MRIERGKKRLGCASPPPGKSLQAKSRGGAPRIGAPASVFFCGTECGGTVVVRHSRGGHFPVQRELEEDRFAELAPQHLDLAGVHQRVAGRQKDQIPDGRAHLGEWAGGIELGGGEGSGPGDRGSAGFFE